MTLVTCDVAGEDVAGVGAESLVHIPRQPHDQLDCPLKWDDELQLAAALEKVGSPNPRKFIFFSFIQATPDLVSIMTILATEDHDDVTNTDESLIFQVSEAHSLRSRHEISEGDALDHGGHVA